MCVYELSMLKSLPGNKYFAYPPDVLTEASYCSCIWNNYHASCKVQVLKLHVQRKGPEAVGNCCLPIASCLDVFPLATYFYSRAVTLLAQWSKLQSLSSDVGGPVCQLLFLHTGSWSGTHCPPVQLFGSCYCWYDARNLTSIIPTLSSPFRFHTAYNNIWCWCQDTR